MIVSSAPVSTETTHLGKSFLVKHALITYFIPKLIQTINDILVKTHFTTTTPPVYWKLLAWEVAKVGMDFSLLRLASKWLESFVSKFQVKITQL